MARKAPLTPVPDLSSLEKLPDAAFAVTAAGGSFSGLAETPEAIACDRFRYTDTSVPALKRRIAKNVRLLLIAADQTTLSVHLKTGGLSKLLRRGGSFQISDGLNCLLAAGYYAGTYTVSLAQNRQDYIADYTSVRNARGGQLRDFTDCMLLGPGGASGGAGALMHGAITAPYIVGCGFVRLQRVRLGFIGHLGCRTDRRIEQNHAAALCQDLFWLLENIEDKPDQALVTRELYLFDVANCGKDRTLRDYRHGVIAQALLCQEMRADFNEFMCNANVNDLGRVCVLQFGLCNQIPRSHVAALAHQTYREPVEKFQQAGSMPTAGLGEIQLKIQDRPVAGVVGFADFHRMVEDRTTTAKALLQEADRIELQPRAVGFIPMANDEPLYLSQLNRRLESYPQTFTGFQDKKKLVDSLTPKVVKKRKEAMKLVKRAKRALVKKVAWLLFLMVWSFAKGNFLSRILSLPQPPQWKKKRLLAAFNAVRVAAYKLASETSKLNLLKRTFLRLKFEQVRIATQMSVVLQALEPMAAGRGLEPLVNILPLDAAWPYLLELAPSNAVENQRTLSRLMTTVNPRGLKRILGAKDFDVRSLARAIQDPPAVEWGPHFGDLATRHYSKPRVVLPPISPGLRKSLSDEFGDDKAFYVADSAAAGITAVLIKESTPNSIDENGLEEIVTPAVRNAFIETLDPSVRDEFYPAGDDAPSWLAELLGIPFPKNVQQNTNHRVVPK